METQEQELAKKEQKLKEKDKEVAELQKENVNIKKEIKQEKDKYNSEWSHIFWYSQKNNAYLVWGQKP